MKFTERTKIELSETNRKNIRSINQALTKNIFRFHHLRFLATDNFEPTIMLHSKKDLQKHTKRVNHR